MAESSGGSKKKSSSTAPRTRILVDLIHSQQNHKDNHRLSRSNYGYKDVHAFARLFDHLASHSYEWEVIEEGELSLGKLSLYNILFINIPDRDSAPFTAQEIDAIHKFMYLGGGVLLIAEHTNCYHHAEKLNPICKPLGIEIQYTSALDVAEECVDPFGWIAISNFTTTHPINAGVRKLTFQLGGTLKTSHGAAFLSPNGFATLWDPSNAPSFISRQPRKDVSSEYCGSLPLIAARDVGKGRVVVVGDSNIYGDTWIHYYDNFTHALNVFEWLGKREMSKEHKQGEGGGEEEDEQDEDDDEDDDDDEGGEEGTKAAHAEICLRHSLPKTKNLVLFDTSLSHNAAGRAGPEDCYSFFVNFNRDPTFTAHAAVALQELDYDSEAEQHQQEGRGGRRRGAGGGDKYYDVLVLPPLRTVADATNVQVIQDCLRAGNTVVVLSDTRHMSKASALLLHDLVPELSIEAYNPTTMGLASLFKFAAFPVKALETGIRGIERVTLNTRLKAMQIKGAEHKDDEGLSLSGYSFACIKSSWGEPFLQTKGKMMWDIARIGRVMGGRLIVFLQCEFFFNKYIGNNETQAPEGRAQDGVRIQYWLMRMLSAMIELAEEEREPSESFVQCADEAMQEAYERHGERPEGDLSA